VVRMCKLIGSSAIKEYFSNFRDVRDKDYLVLEYKENTKGIEYHIAKTSGLRQLYYFIDVVATPEQSLAIKMSHLIYKINWRKHAYDTVFLLNNGIIPDYFLIDILRKDWNKIHGKKKANLLVPNEQFFTGTINRKYIHDDIHKAIAYYDEPMYEKLKNNKSLAYIPQANFDKLSYDDKVKCCREEIYAVALERVLIPNNFTCSSKEAYLRSLEHLVTSMSKGWFPNFIIKNLHTLIHPDNHPFVKLCKEHIKNGNIRRI